MGVSGEERERVGVSGEERERVGDSGEEGGKIIGWDILITLDNR